MKEENSFIISEEEAIKLLVTQNEEPINNQNIFDEYGNYTFPTDIVMSRPNSACGTITTDLFDIR